MSRGTNPLHESFTRKVSRGRLLLLLCLPANHPKVKNYKLPILGPIELKI